MLDGHASLRAMYHAPVPLVVLGADRTIQMLSRPAEKLLQVEKMACLGHPMERYITPDSYDSYTSLLNKASLRLSATANASDHLPMPCGGRIQLQRTGDKRPSHWCDLDVSAWHMVLDEFTLFSGEPSIASRSSHLLGDDPVRGGGAHSALFTLSLSVAKTQSGPADDVTTNTAQPCQSHQKSDLNQSKREERRKQEMQVQGDIDSQQIVETIPQLIWMNGPTGLAEWCSKSFYDYTGASPENLGSGWTDLVHEDDVGEVATRWVQAMRDGNSYDLAFRLRRHDSTWRWFLARAAPKRDPETNEIIRWFGTCTDIHEQVEALSASQQSQSQLQSVINHADVTLWAVDKEGRLTVAEGPGLEALGLGSGSESVTVKKPVDDDEAHSNDDTEMNECVAADKGGLPLLPHGSPAAAAATGEGSKSNKETNSVLGQSIYELWSHVSDVRKLMGEALQGTAAVNEMQVEGRWFRTSFAPLRAPATDIFTVNAEPTHAIFSDSDATAAGGQKGEIIGVVGASMDITDRKMAQVDLASSLLAQSRALAAEEAAQEASRLKSQFLANMSHEIRTPLAGIIGLTELILDEDHLTGKQVEYAETILRSAEGLLTVINDVLDFSKVEVGKLVIEDQPFSLVVIMEDVRRMMTLAAEKKGLNFAETLNIKYRGQLVGDFGRVTQIIMNLLSNAIKFTEEGGHVTLDIEEEEEKRETSEDADTVVFRFDIRDTGCGINSKVLSRLFQPFSQADASTARLFGGTGLGLSICKNLVELMKGNITLQSVEGQGSHVSFTIPFRKAEQEGLPCDIDGGRRKRRSPPCAQTTREGGVVTAWRNQVEMLDDDEDDWYDDTGSATATSMTTNPSADDTAMKGPIGSENKWILIVEDNAVNARIAEKNVEKLGFKSVVARNGLVALEEVHKRNFDLVLMDCQMPLCDGYEATERIRKSRDQDIRCLPVVALTASAIKGDRERALGAGMVDYLVKPVKKADLAMVLGRWLFDEETRKTLARFQPHPTKGLKRERQPSWRSRLDC